MDDEKFNSIINTKCSLCYRKDAKEDTCLLVQDRHPGIELCLGPFKDQEDRLRKLREDFERERKLQPDFKRLVGDALKNKYELNKKIFETGKKKRKKKSKPSHKSKAEAQLVLQLSGESTSAASEASDHSIKSSKRGFAGNV